jgi:hypothetical protein
LGHLGKEKMHKLNLFSYHHQSAAPIRRAAIPNLAVPTLAISALALAACTGSQETYVGTLKPRSGICDVLNRATLQRHGANIQFTPQDGVLVLDGTWSGTGQLTAAQQTIGMDRKPYTLQFTGQAANGTISGSYVTPRCHYEVNLKISG